MRTFSEREFYLQEFRGRTLAIAFDELPDPKPLVRVVRALVRNRTAVVLIARRRGVLPQAVAGTILDASGDRLEARVWRELREHGCIGLVAAGSGSLAAAARRLALRLRLFKVVLLDAAGGLRDRRSRPRSFVDRRALGQLLPRAARRRRPLREIAAMLDGGIPAVNLCAPERLAEELFTYAGSGTLFTRDRYVEVRGLGIDDFSAAEDLVARGVAEGYLVPRSPPQLDRILARAFGAFVEGRHLAGIGALVDHPGTGWAEIASLYTVTRFLGEGVGGHLVAFALGEAARRSVERVFACTRSERVGAFFVRQGFERVELAALPRGKWRGYDRTRRRSVTAYGRACTRSAG